MSEIPMPLTAVKSTVGPGSMWHVTNHRPGCGGARYLDRLAPSGCMVVVGVTSASFRLAALDPDTSGLSGDPVVVPWPVAARVSYQRDGKIGLWGPAGRDAGDLWLTLAPLQGPDAQVRQPAASSAGKPR